MNDFQTLFTLIPKLLPLLPQIASGLKTVERVMNDPDIKAAIRTFEQVIDILKQTGVSYEKVASLSGDDEPTANVG